MNDPQVMHAMELDDSYRVLDVLSDGPLCRTELVAMGDAGPFVRKRIPLQVANRAAWGAAMGVLSKRVPRVVAMYEMPDELVVVCEHVEGSTLEQVVEAKGTLAPAEAASIARQVCEAASALHAVGIVHRDITPKNVIIAADGAHLIDLGIARLRTEGGTHDTTLLGTYGFASPEQYGFAKTDERSDVYSIGRLLQYMLTGSADGSLQADGVVKTRLVSIIRIATQFEPSKRFKTTDALVRALCAVLDHESTMHTKATSQPNSSPAGVRNNPQAIMTSPTGETNEEQVSMPVPATGRTLASMLRIISLPPMPPSAPIREKVLLGQAWEEAKVWEKVLGMATFLLFALVGILFLMVGNDNAHSGGHGLPITNYVLGIAFCTMFVLVGLDSLRAAVCAGTYRRDGHRLRRWLLSTASDLVIFTAVLFLISVVLLLATGSG